MDTVERMLEQLRWLGHASFRIEGTPTIYFDPWQLSGTPPPADLILVSHEHHDHCSPDDVKAIRHKNTRIVANPTAAAKLGGAVTVLRPGERTKIGDVEIQAVPAYNINKRFHPRASQHVGFVVDVRGVRFYHAGDTDHIPEMTEIDCDVAMLPVSGTYVMTAAEAVAAARDIQPQVVVPMHWGAGVAGTRIDAEQFRDQWEGKTVILTRAA